MKAKKRNREYKTPKRKDRHHIWYYHHDYNKGWAKALRTHWYCTVEIPKDTLHKRIHRDVPMVPVPSTQVIQGALFQLQMLEKLGAIHPYDNIERRLYVLMALFECVCPDTHAALKKQYLTVCKFYRSCPKAWGTLRS